MAEDMASGEQRAALLRQYDLGNAADRAAFDRITAFLAQLCESPIALVSIVGPDRQEFIGRTGLDAEGTPRELSFCAHAMLGDDIMVVPDARMDPRFADNALVTGEPGIRFYAGAPLTSKSDEPLGSLCVIDREPRAGLSDLQRQGLLTLAAEVADRLEGQRRTNLSRAQNRKSQKALTESEQRFQVLADSMPQMVWSTQPDGFHDYYNARWYQFTGMPDGSTDGEGWNDMFHPEDQERAWARWRHSLETGDPYEIEYRLRHHSGEYRWTLGRALPMRDESGTIIRWFGTCTDIHEQKLALEERELIAHELSHRIKNIFSVIAGLIGLSAREYPGLNDLADDLRDRVLALGRAHDQVRPHSSRSAPMVGSGNSLKALIREIMAPYGSRSSTQIRIEGPDVEIDDRSATPLALSLHELATNAARYGALSIADGGVHIDISSTADTCTIIWREQGGPDASRPGEAGFGTRMIQLSVGRQLGGTIAAEWRPEGLTTRLVIPAKAMNRQRA